MALKIKTIDRTLAKTQAGQLVHMAPGWLLTIDSKNHGTVTIDCNSLRRGGRDELAGQFRDAFWSMRHESEGISLIGYETAIRRFYRFLEYDEEFNAPVLRLAQIDRSCIERYLAWLGLQLIPPGQKNSGERLSNASSSTAYSGLKSILVNRQKLSPFDVSKELTFPRNPFPNSARNSGQREPFSPTEHRRILDAINANLQSMHSSDTITLTSIQVLVTHMLVLAIATGGNLQPLLELKRDSLNDHPLADRELLVTSKRRGRTTFATSVRKSQDEGARDTPHTIPRSIGDHFRSLCAYTLPLTQENPSIAEFVFLWRVSRGIRKGTIVRLTRLEIKTAIRDFARQHRLKDDAGQPMAISFGRFRPTFATELYRRSRDIRTVSRALGHANPETTARSYAKLPVEAERNHALVAESMVMSFTQTSVNGKIMLAADGTIPFMNEDGLLPGGYNTGIARCANPFREDDAVCKKFFTCFRCPNMMVFEDDLWRLFSFYNRLLSERAKMRSVHWMKTYAPILKRIDDQIAPMFPADIVEVARTRARVDPHPTWRAPLQ